MRQIIILIFLALSNLTFGQSQFNSLKRNPDIYTFNNSKDTIYLTKVDLEQWTMTESVIIFDTIQIDGFGSKEIVFARTCSGKTEAHGATFDFSESTTISKYEIWNLDTKTLLFEAVNFYETDYNRWDLRMLSIPDSLGIYGMGIGSCSYSYDFSIDSIGQININHIKNINHCQADKKEGLYKFINGKYTNE